MTLCFVLLVISLNLLWYTDNRFLDGIITGIQVFLFLASVVFGLLHWVWLVRVTRSAGGLGAATRVSLAIAIIVTTPYLLFALFTVFMNIAILFGWAEP
jgi:hypothetical protein